MFHSCFQLVTLVLEKSKKVTNRLFFTWAVQSDSSLNSDCTSLSYVFSRQKEERSVLLGIGCLEFIAEPEPPLLLELQPAHRLPEGASICTDDTQSRTYRGGRHGRAVRPLLDRFTLHSLYIFGVIPLRKEKFLRNPGVTKESAKQSRRPLKSSPTVLMLTE